MESSTHLSPTASSSRVANPFVGLASTSGVRASINDPPHWTHQVVTARFLDSRSSTGEDAQQPGSHLYQLVVRPILKTTISQRGSSGETLEDFAVNGSSFRDIFPKLWERFSPRVKRRAVKAEEEWSLQPPAMEDWSKVMQFKAKRHIVTVLNLIERGILGFMLLGRNCQATCVRVWTCGATAEICLHEVVESLKERWESEYDAPAVVWRMWANRVTSNLDRSIGRLHNRGPPADILKMLRASESRLADHITSVSRSSNLALNCVVASLRTARRYAKIGTIWKKTERPRKN
ncbi:hypothetical protein GQ600_26276 [Phytophthora cactorum]|nr:hypothetical protein GQ600_26276 [Phytophthora cactorum]